MKTKIKTVYYCEYCGRHRLTSHSIKKHEEHCTLNPHRVCGMCGLSDLTPLLEKYRNRFKIEKEEAEFGTTLNEVQLKWVWTDGEVTIEDIQDDVEGCPACTLAILRQTAMDRYPSPLDGFDYQKARKEWWQEVNAAKDDYQ